MSATAAEANDDHEDKMEWPFDQEWTDSQLDSMRRRSIDKTEIEEFTCDDCPWRYRCDLVFDHYNQDGDCLANK